MILREEDDGGRVMVMSDEKNGKEFTPPRLTLGSIGLWESVVIALPAASKAEPRPKTVLFIVI